MLPYDQYTGEGAYSGGLKMNWGVFLMVMQIVYAIYFIGIDYERLQHGEISNSEFVINTVRTAGHTSFFVTMALGKMLGAAIKIGTVSLAAICNVLYWGAFIIITAFELAHLVVGIINYFNPPDLYLDKFRLIVPYESSKRHGGLRKGDTVKFKIDYENTGKIPGSFLIAATENNYFNWDGRDPFQNGLMYFPGQSDRLTVEYTFWRSDANASCEVSMISRYKPYGSPWKVLWNDSTEVSFGPVLPSDITSFITESEITHWDTLDWDGDGLDFATENRFNTDPWNVDTDDDGLSDYDELNVLYTNPLNKDTDGDYLPDGFEITGVIRSNPNDPDTDGDLLLDGYEILVFGTAPDNNDTNGDGISDFVSVQDILGIYSAVPHQSLESQTIGVGRLNFEVIYSYTNFELLMKDPKGKKKKVKKKKKRKKHPENFGILGNDFDMSYEEREDFYDKFIDENL